MRRCDHVDGLVSLERTDRFVLGIPLGSKACEMRLLACGLVRRPPGFELLVPALTIRGSADPDRSPPDGGVSMGVHDVLLSCVLASASVCGLIDQPLESKYRSW